MKITELVGERWSANIDNDGEVNVVDRDNGQELHELGEVDPDEALELGAMLVILTGGDR